MAFKSDIVEKVTAVNEKYDKKKAELQQKRSDLTADVDHLRSELENDLQRQIMEEATADKRLQKDYDATAAELNRINSLLSDFENLRQKALQKHVDTVEKARQKVADTITAENDQYIKELAALKYQYLDKLCDHVELRRKFSGELNAFREVAELLGLKDVRASVGFEVIPDFQPHYKYSPVPNVEEIKNAYSNGQISYTSNQQRKFYLGK
jgi:chromosome segregation ATPase